jgi:hypothetical protein
VSTHRPAVAAAFIATDLSSNATTKRSTLLRSNFPTHIKAFHPHVSTHRPTFIYTVGSTHIQTLNTYIATIQLPYSGAVWAALWIANHNTVMQAHTPLIATNGTANL